MDNLTHGLVGWALADAVLAGLARRGHAPSPLFARVLRATCIVAANAPDLDLAHTIGDGTRLGYLVHHRGYTHTLLALPVLWLVGALALALGQRLWRWPLRPWHWQVVGVSAALALATHLPLDYGNNYGIHPFWPWDDRWYYGDAVYIIEPVLWVALGFGVYRADASPWFKGFLAFLALATVSLPWLSSMATVTSAVLLTVAVLAAAWGAWRWPQPRRLRACALAVGLFLGVSYGASAYVRAALRAELAATGHGAEVEDVLVTPRPANPTCWSHMAVLGDGGGRYRLLGGGFSLWASEGHRETCRALADRPHSMPTSAASLSPRDPRVTWEWEFQGDTEALRDWAARSCAVRAFGQFARAPFWSVQAGALYVGDARYDRTAGQDFAEITVDERKPDACPALAAPWLPPRPRLFPAP